MFHQQEQMLLLMEVFYFNSNHYSDPINTISLSVFLSFLARTNPFLG